MKTGKKSFVELSERTQDEIAELIVKDKYVSDVLDKRIFRNLSKRTQEEVAELVLSDDYIERERKRIKEESVPSLDLGFVFNVLLRKEKKEAGFSEQEAKKNISEETIDIKLMRHNLGIEFDREKKAVPLGWDTSEWAQMGEKYMESDVMELKSIGMGYKDKFLQEIEQKTQDYLRQEFAEQKRMLSDAGNIASHIIVKGRHISELVGQ